MTPAPTSFSPPRKPNASPWLDVAPYGSRATAIDPTTHLEVTRASSAILAPAPPHVFAHSCAPMPTSSGGKRSRVNASEACPRPLSQFASLSRVISRLADGSYTRSPTFRALRSAHGPPRWPQRRRGGLQPFSPATPLRWRRSIRLRPTAPSGASAEPRRLTAHRRSASLPPTSRWGRSIRPLGSALPAARLGSSARRG